MTENDKGAEAPAFLPVERLVESPHATEKPRLVLDTNTVMALWMFDDPTLAPLREAVEAETVALVTREDALEELRRVLQYRQFGVTPAIQSSILSRYRLACSVIPLPAEEPVVLPQCRDTDDQKFLEIARDGFADYLVSRDKALLKLGRHRLVRSLYRIVTPEVLCKEGLAPPARSGRDDKRCMT